MSILTAARDTQTAAEVGGRGLFTSVLCQALEGEAADVLGEVSVPAVYAFVDALLDPWGQRPLFKAHVESLAVLRRATSAVDRPVLRRLSDLFASPGNEYPLSPRHEHTEEGFDPQLNGEFGQLQCLRDGGLVESVGFEYMYDAALNSASCRLTPLGRRLWALARAGRL